MANFEVYRLDRQGYSDWWELEPVLLQYAQKLRKNIKISVPHRELSSIDSEDGFLLIKVFACPEDGPFQMGNIKTAYGIRLLDSQDDCMLPGGSPTVVYDHDGVPVAQFADGCIFILFDLVHGPNSGTLMSLVLDDYVQFTKSKEDFVKMISNRTAESSFKNFCDIFLGELANQDDNIVEQIRDIESEIRDLQKEIIQKNRDREKLSKKRKLFQIMLKEHDEAKSLEVYETLMKYSVTGTILVDKRSIIIPVGQVEIDYEGETYEIGDFDLIIYPNGDFGGVRCINKTRNIDGNYHPHVDSSGECCLGNISDSVAQLVGTMEYEMVVILMLQFLRSCNEDGWYDSVTSWPNKNGEVSDDQLD